MATDLSTVWVWFTSNFNTASSANSCLLYYARAPNQLFLMNDAGTAWSSPATPGVAATLGNSSCSINMGLASVTTSGMNLTLNLPVAFTAADTGAKGIDMFAAGSSASSVWQQMGSWDVPATLGLSVASAHSGSFVQGQNGAAYTVMVSNAPGPATSGTVTVTDTLPSGLTLVSMTGAAGSGWTCTGNTCTRSDALAGGTSYPAITVTVNVAANAASPQLNQVGLARVLSGVTTTASGADQTTIVVPTGPAPVSATPDSGSGAQPTFALQYVDPLGAADLATVWVWFTSNFSSGSSASSCLVYYAQPSNQLFLVNDAGTAESSSTLGAGGVALSNSQCLINAGAASVAHSGTDLILNLPVTFTAAYDGAKSIYMYAAGSSANSGWQTMGSWTVQALPAALTVTSTHSGSFTQGQNGAVYTVTVANASGAGPTDGPVTVTETAPAGLTLVSMTGSGWTCGASSCARSDGLAGGSSYPAITATVNVGWSASGTVTNSVSVSGGGSATSPGSDPTNIVSDFTITLSAPNPATVIAGSPATYTVTVGPGIGFTSTVTPAALGLPAGATASFNPTTISSTSGPSGWSSTMTVTSPVSLTAGVVGTSGTLSHTATAQGVLTVQDFTLTVTPSSSSASPWVVTAGQTLNFTVSAAGANGFSKALNVSLGLPGYSYFGGTVTPGAPLNFSWVLPANTAGGAFSYSIIAQLNGPGGLTHSVTGQLAVAAQNFSFSVVQTPPIVTASWPGSANFTMTFTSINNFAGPVFFEGVPFPGWTPFYPGVNGIVYTYPSVTLTAGGTTTSQFSIEFGGTPLPYGPGPYPFYIFATNGSVSQLAFDSITFGSGALGYVLSVASTHTGSFAVGQSGSGTYFIVVTNQTGAGASSGLVTVTDALPAGLTLASMSGSGWSCTGNVCSRSDSLNGGASYPPITVLVNVGLNAPSQVTNQVSVAYTVDGNSQSAVGTDNTSTQGSDFTLLVSPSPQPVIPGQTASFQVSVNGSPSFNSAVNLNLGALAGRLSASLRLDHDTAGAERYPKCDHFIDDAARAAADPDHRLRRVAEQLQAGGDQYGRRRTDHYAGDAFAGAWGPPADGLLQPGA